MEMKDRRTIKDWERAIDFSDEEWDLVCLADQNGLLLRSTATFDVMHVTPDERKEFFRLLKQLVTERSRLRGVLDRAGIHPRPITTELKPR